MTSPGIRIQQLLDEQQITQRKLAADLNLNPNTVNGYIHNRRSPDWITAVRIAEYLGTNIDYLLGRTPVKCYPELALSEEEGRLLGNYRAMSEDHRQILIALSTVLLTQSKHSVLPEKGSNV